MARKVNNTAQSKNSSLLAYDTLLNSIMCFDLKPGSIINEAQVAEQLQVSRTPVHEAVLRLRDRELVDVIPRVESRVSKINISHINDAVFIRKSLEPEIFSLAHSIPSADYYGSVSQNIDDTKRCIEENDLKGFFQCDNTFDKLVYEWANKPMTYELVRSASGHLDRVRFLHYLDDDWTDLAAETHAEHKNLFSFIAYGAPLSMELRAYLHMHITKFQSSFERLLKAKPEFFTYM